MKGCMFASTSCVADEQAVRFMFSLKLNFIRDEILQGHTPFLQILGRKGLRYGTQILIQFVRSLQTTSFSFTWTSAATRTVTSDGTETPRAKGAGKCRTVANRECVFCLIRCDVAFIVPKDFPLRALNP